MNNKKPDKKEIENKLNLVIDKLMNLGRPAMPRIGVLC